VLDDLDIAATAKSRRISLAGREQINQAQVTKWTPESERPLGRPRQQWEDGSSKRP